MKIVKLDLKVNNRENMLLTAFEVGSFIKFKPCLGSKDGRGFKILFENQIDAYVESVFRSLTIKDAYVRIDENTVLRLNTDINDNLEVPDLAALFFDMRVDKEIEDIVIKGELNRETLIITEISLFKEKKNITLECANRWENLVRVVEEMMSDEEYMNVYSLHELDIELLDLVRLHIKKAVSMKIDTIEAKLNSTMNIPKGGDWTYVNFKLSDNGGGFINTSVNDLVKYFPIVELEKYFDISKNRVNGEYSLTIKEEAKNRLEIRILNKTISTSSLKRLFWTYKVDLQHL